MSDPVVPTCDEQGCDEQATFSVSIDGETCENVLGHSHDPDSDMYDEEFDPGRDFAYMCLSHIGYVQFDCPSKTEFVGNIDGLVKQATDWPKRYERLSA